MSQVDLNRSFLFADALSTGRYPHNKPTLCSRAPGIIGVGDGSEFGLVPTGSDGKPLEAEEDPEGAAPGYKAVGRYGRFTTGNRDAGDSFTFEALVYPDLDTKLTLTTWRGQNFAAFCTDWENQNSPLVNFNARPKLTPVVDVCGMV